MPRHYFCPALKVSIHLGNFQLARERGIGLPGIRGNSRYMSFGASLMRAGLCGFGVPLQFRLQSLLSIVDDGRIHHWPQWEDWEFDDACGNLSLRTRLQDFKKRWQNWHKDKQRDGMRDCAPGEAYPPTSPAIDCFFEEDCATGGGELAGQHCRNTIPCQSKPRGESYGQVELSLDKLHGL